MFNAINYGKNLTFFFYFDYLKNSVFRIKPLFGLKEIPIETIYKIWSQSCLRSHMMILFSLCGASSTCVPQARSTRLGASRFKSVPYSTRVEARWRLAVSLTDDLNSCLRAVSESQEPVLDCCSRPRSPRFRPVFHWACLKKLRFNPEHCSSVYAGLHSSFFCHGPIF